MNTSKLGAVALLKRRQVIKALPVVAAGCAAPALAQTGNSHFGEPTRADLISHHVAEIERLLQEAAPDGVEQLASVCWKVGGGMIWATGDQFEPFSRRYVKLVDYYQEYRPSWMDRAEGQIHV